MCFNAHGVSDSTSTFYGCFVCAQRALSTPFRRFWGWADSLPILHECAARGIEVHPAGVFYFKGYGVLFDESKTKDPEVKSKRAKWVALAAKHGVGVSVAPSGDVVYAPPSVFP